MKRRPVFCRCVPTHLDMRDGVIAPAEGGGASINLADLAEIIYFKVPQLPAGPQIHLIDLHASGTRLASALVPTNGIQACLAEVDVRTGFVRLLRHWAVDDFGMIVNPLLGERAGARRNRAGHRSGAV